MIRNRLSRTKELNCPESVQYVARNPATATTVATQTGPPGAGSTQTCKRSASSRTALRPVPMSAPSASAQAKSKKLSSYSRLLLFELLHQACHFDRAGGGLPALITRFGAGTLDRLFDTVRGQNSHRHGYLRVQRHLGDPF